MDLLDCRVLKLLFETHNITKTAQALFISQPALSKRIKRLEAEFGVPIIYRRSKGIEFTQQGQHLVSTAEQTLMGYELLRQDLRTIAEEEISGLLKIGSIYLINERVVPRVIAEFSKLFPAVTFDILSQPNARIYNKIQNNEIHLAIMRENYSWPYVKELIATEHIYLVSKEEIDIQHLPDYPRIDPARNTKLNALLDRWWIDHFSKEPKIFANVSNSNTGLELVREGLGYSFVSSISLAQYQDVYIVPLTDLNGNRIQRSTWLYYKEASLHLRQVAAFITFVETNRHLFQIELP